MAEAAVTFLLENVKKLLLEQINLISGADKELQQLKNELELMKAFLTDSATKKEKGEVFIQFERQIREAVYEAEDTIDTCLTAKAKASGLRSLMNLDLAKKVKELRQELLRPMFDRAMAGLTALPSRADGSGTDLGRSDEKLKKAQMLREDNIVGFADEEATLTKYLRQETNELDVISVVGMPGLGKTTLAWKIYRHPEIQYQFPTLIWVYISQEFNVKEVFLTILKKFTQQDMSGKDIHELKRLVKSNLKSIKFLLFMDDVWTIEDWRQIEDALPKDNKLGKVLITSRYARVATQANRSREPHKLRFLHFEESWELLQLEVFGKNNCCPKELEGLGKQIARECKGVPLAIVVIGGILLEKSVERKDFWKKVSDDVSAHVGFDNERMKNIIALSYNKLPHELRDCFLYLGMFPEDCEIPAWKLTRLWIAEGFIQENRGRCFEEVAEDNLNDLVARNLVMVEKTKANGEIKTCRVHDMIREFCRNEAAYDNKNLFQEVKKTRHGVFDPAISEIEKRRRVCIHSNVVDFLQRKPLKGPGVRSFVCFSEETINLPQEHNSSIPDAFELLRVIDASSIKFTKLPSKLTRLIHLRYIALSGNELKALPESVSKLWNLQTVNITTTSREFDIKADIGKMKHLRHLKTKAAICLKEVKGEGGENLQTLSRLSAKCCKEELFNRVPNLKNLGIRGNLTKTLMINSNCLEKLDHLEKLKLVHDVFPTTPDDSALHRLPHQQNFPPNLRILTLSSTNLSWSNMTTLGSLQNLEVLKLKEMAFKGKLWEAEGGGFTSLETLHISRTDLETWTASGDPFPKLKNLILKNCERLEEIPTLVWKSLQLVEIERVTPKLVESCKRMEVEKQQVQEEFRVKKGVLKLKISPGDASTSQVQDSGNL